MFVDEFDRPDDLDLGNGWIEKNPAAFQIVAGQIVFQSSVGEGYPHNVVYRPFSDSVADVEVTAEFELLENAPPGHPQVHARLQADDIDPTQSVTCYILFISNEAELMVTRQEAGVFSRQAIDTISTPQLGERYRLRLRVEGTDPVEIDGYLERLGSADWVEEGHVVLQDTDATRIVDAGTVALSGDSEIDHYRYERFTAQEL